ncbi:MAG: hypothetical protein AB7F65_08600 [Dehalococcoidia bacterium]
MMQAKLFRGVLTLGSGLAVLAATFSSASAQSVPEVDLRIAVTAEILEADAPAGVEATAVIVTDGRPSHGVRVTWEGSGSATLDDARFAHHVTAEEGTGDLIVTGRGCGANVDGTTGDVFIACTADLQLIDVAPGETHQYPVNLTPVLDGRRLEPGVYVVDEPIAWQVDADTFGMFTVRLTYVVAPAAEGVLSPAPSATGVSLASWSGGPAAELPEAKAYWATAEGRFVAYVPSAPAFVNAGFFSHFPELIPPGTLFIVIR